MQTTSVLSESGLAPLSLKKKNRSCKATVYTQYLLHYTCHISYYDIIYIYIIRKLCISSLCYITSFLFLTPSLVQIDLNHCKNTWKTSSIESPHFETCCQKISDIPIVHSKEKENVHHHHHHQMKKRTNLTQKNKTASFHTSSCVQFLFLFNP